MASFFPNSYRARRRTAASNAGRASRTATGSSSTPSWTDARRRWWRPTAAPSSGRGAGQTPTRRRKTGQRGPNKRSNNYSNNSKNNNHNNNKPMNLRSLQLLSLCFCCPRHLPQLRHNLPNRDCPSLRFPICYYCILPPLRLLLHRHLYSYRTRLYRLCLPTQRASPAWTRARCWGTRTRTKSRHTSNSTKAKRHQLQLHSAHPEALRHHHLPHLAARILNCC